VQRGKDSDNDIARLKDTLIRLLEEDKGFRYTVAGLIGYKEVMDRLADVTQILIGVKDNIASMSDEIRGLRQEMIDGFNKRDEMIQSIIREMHEGFRRSDERMEQLRQEMIDGFNKRDEMIQSIIREMHEGFRRSDERMEQLRQEMIAEIKRHDKQFKSIDRRLRNIESYIERTSITLEEEAREVIAYRLREKGIMMSIGNLVLPDVEIDIYATDTATCLIGEAKTRVSTNVIDKVDKDIEELCRRYPEYLRDKVIKVVYGMQVLPGAIEEAKKRGIWLVTANKELTELNIR
jgi:uncharacterized protein YejL (UPF0352 family)